MCYAKNTLKDLVIEGINAGSKIKDFKWKIYLEKFHANIIDEKFMSHILKSASNTLQEITLENISSSEEVVYDDLIFPQLKRFSVDRTKFDIVKSVLKSLQSPLEMLAVTDGDMNNISFNSDLLEFLVKFGANNPNCFLRLK